MLLKSKANSKELETLQEIITTCSLQLAKNEERNKQLTENLKGILNVMPALCLLVLLEVRSQILEVGELLKGSHPQLSLKLKSSKYKCKFF